MAMGTGGAITAVAATTTVGTEATTMVGGIIAIGGDCSPQPRRERLHFEDKRRTRGRCVDLCLHEKPGIIDRLKHRQLISSPGKIQRFTAGSHMPLFTSYFVPFMATCVGRGCLPAPE